MFNPDEAKNDLTQKLSDQYSRNKIDLEEYERILEYVNKVETEKEIAILDKIIRENDADNNGLRIKQDDAVSAAGDGEKHLSMFSWRTSNVKSADGNGGEFVSLFGTNRIIADNLPKGRTVIKVNSIFGLTEILVPQNTRVVSKVMPVFSGIFMPNEVNQTDEESPELYIVGNAVFGNITIKTMGLFDKLFN
jgi:hypothetical protein